jgi:hypothetical protein
VTDIAESVEQATGSKQEPASPARARSARSIMTVALLDIAFLIIGIFGSKLRLDPYAAYALSAVGIGITTFCGFYYMARTMSDAIAASFVLLYFVVESYLLFLPGVRGSLAGTTAGALTETARELINNLTTFITIIVST